MEDTVSYSNIHGDWEVRKIPVMGAVKSFVTQLRKGQDLTRISLPSCFLRPYSILEEACTRSIGNVDLLIDVPEIPTAEERMKQIVKWLLSSGKLENLNHKPYNPVLGEEHKARYDFEDGKKVFFLAEQVEHHPPVSAFHLISSNKKLSVEGNTNFSVTFNGNSVSVNMLGEMRIILKIKNDQGEFTEEVYTFSKCTPDLLIQNVIIGKKHVVLYGDIFIKCPSTGYSSKLNFDFKNNKSRVKGEIKKDENVIYEINGSAVGETLISEKNNRSELLCDASKARALVPKYPSIIDLASNSSILLWSPVTQAIIKNDMITADQKKNEIEEMQRNLIAEGGFAPKYFENTGDNIWKVKNPDWFETSDDVNPDANK